MKRVKIQLLLSISLAFIIIHILSPNEKIKKIIKDPNLNYNNYTPDPSDLIISRSNYANRLYGFWLGQCIANWTGLVTEMDKIGDIGDIRTGKFYTRKDWGKPDQPNIWSNGKPSTLSPTIDFVFVDKGDIWGGGSNKLDFE